MFWIRRISFAGGEREELLRAKRSPLQGSDPAEVLICGNAGIREDLGASLDGFFAPTGVLFMMTTNRIEALDPALLRPGRIDCRLYFGNASDRQKIELYRRFFPEATESQAREIVEACRSAETMAEFQGLLLGMAEDPSGRNAAERFTRPQVQEEEAESASLAG
jgi:chaperone BCS1